MLGVGFFGRGVRGCAAGQRTLAARAALHRHAQSWLCGPPKRALCLPLLPQGYADLATPFLDVFEEDWEAFWCMRQLLGVRMRHAFATPRPPAAPPSPTPASAHAAASGGGPGVEGADGPGQQQQQQQLRQRRPHGQAQPAGAGHGGAGGGSSAQGQGLTSGAAPAAAAAVQHPCSVMDVVSREIELVGGALQRVGCRLCARACVRSSSARWWPRELACVHVRACVCCCRCACLSCNPCFALHPVRQVGSVLQQADPKLHRWGL